MRRLLVNRPHAGTEARRTNRTRGLAALASLLVPGVGHFMLGRYPRGAVWLAGFLALALTGAAHLLPGLLLMAVAALDTWWVGAPRSINSSTPLDEG